MPYVLAALAPNHTSTRRDLQEFCHFSCTSHLGVNATPTHLTGRENCRSAGPLNGSVCIERTASRACDRARDVLQVVARRTPRVSETDGYELPHSSRVQEKLKRPVGTGGYGLRVSLRGLGIEHLDCFQEEKCRGFCLIDLCRIRHVSSRLLTARHAAPVFRRLVRPRRAAVLPVRGDGCHSA